MSLVNLLRKTCRKTFFTTPSHARRFFIYHKLRNLYKYDISETEAYNPQEALSKAQERTAKIYGTKSTNFLLNGSTSGIIASVLTCVSAGDKVLIWQDAHPCHANALKLAGAIPVYYNLEIDKDFGVPLAVKPEAIENTLKKEKVKAVIVTSPTYEGIVSDIPAIKSLCEKYGAYLIVDEAHGALYPFSDNLPQSAVKIADFTVQSLHKTAGGLNPTALLHCNCELDTSEALKLISTTSPSYPLLASIEANITYLNSKRGRKNLENIISTIQSLKGACPNCQFSGDDVTKILVKHPKYTGYELSEILFEKYSIEDEKTNEKSTMLLCGIGTSEKSLNQLFNALRHIK